jgi:dCTP deaminase
VLLGEAKIRNLLENPDIDPKKRLVISPVLDPDSQLKAGTASIDVRLGQRFQVPQRTKLSELDHLSENHDLDIERYKDETFVQIGDHFILHPRQLVLGETLEWIHLPSNIGAFVIGRSSWGRDGLIIATATGVHPNFSGILTLEISNVGEIPIYLYPGVAIAQLFLTRVYSSGRISQPTPSTFACQDHARSANAAQKDKPIINYFKRELERWSQSSGRPKTKSG